MSSFGEILQAFSTEYKKTPTKVKVCGCMLQERQAFSPARRASVATVHPSPCPQILDAFLIYSLATAAVQVRRGAQRMQSACASLCCHTRCCTPPTLLLAQFTYMLLVGTFPFNAFLAGFLSSLGFFALTSECTRTVGVACQSAYRFSCLTLASSCGRSPGRGLIFRTMSLPLVSQCACGCKMIQPQRTSAAWPQSGRLLTTCWPT
jgi:hypothetical protein